MTFQRTAAAFVLSTALTAPGFAWAQDVPPVVAAILKSWENQLKVKPTYKSISGDNTNATIEGIEAAVPGGPGGSIKVTVDKLELQNISDMGNGLYEVGSATHSGTKLNITGDGQAVAVDMPMMETSSWFIKVLGDNPTPADQFRASMNIAKKSVSGPINVMVQGQTITADKFELTWDGDPVTGAGKTSGGMFNINIPETAMAMMDPSGVMKQLGYATMSFDVGGEGTVTNDGTNFGMDFDGYYKAKDAGTLKIGAAVSGIPLAAIAELQKVPPGQEPNMNALMPQFMTMQFGRIDLRFEDASITNKVLPLIAQMQGMDVPTFIGNAGAMAQLGLSNLKSPEFTKQAVDAINAFLQNPQSITISAKPASPVAISQLMTIDPNNPAAAIQQLGVTVTAND
jgi:hypothetical protein